MEQQFALYSIMPPHERDLEDFPLVDSLSDSEENAWEKFCYPALNKDAYEKDGFKAVKVIVTVRII